MIEIISKTILFNYFQCMQKASQNNPYTPPGGVLIWLFILMELVVFGIGFGTLILQSQAHVQDFQTGKSALNAQMGLAFTVLLLLSGWLLAESVSSYFQKNHSSIYSHRTKTYHSLAILLGFAFIGLKLLDFSQKVQLGYTLGSSRFFDLYWLLTGFHFAHVVLGVSFLVGVNFKLNSRNYEDEDFAVRGSALFWHMCDVAWLFLYPLFYLL